MPSRRSFLRLVGGSVAASCATRQQPCQAAAEPAAAQGIAVTIGLNQLDPQHYVDAPPLRGCVQDAKDVYAIARQAGFTGIAVGAAEIAKVLFFVVLVLFVVSLIAGLFRRGP